MPYTALHFLLLAALLFVFFIFGRRAGRGSPRQKNISFTLAFITLGLCLALAFEGKRFHGFVPLHISVYVDGIWPMLPWAFLIGLLGTGQFSEGLTRARWLLVILGFVVFVHQGAWMVLPNTRPEEAASLSAASVYLQSRDDTCVPSSCATALNMLGISTTEAEMCDIVQAKPLLGSSALRATYGLNKFLKPHGWRAHLQWISAEQVLAQATPSNPILISYRFAPRLNHMVVALGTKNGQALIANPAPKVSPQGYLPTWARDGLEYYSREDFAAFFQGASVVFTKLY